MRSPVAATAAGVAAAVEAASAAAVVPAGAAAARIEAGRVAAAVRARVVVAAVLLFAVGHRRPDRVAREAAYARAEDARAEAAHAAGLRAHSRDPDANVRDAIERALGRLETPSSSARFDPVQPVDLARVRYLVRPGELADRERSDEARGELLRAAVRSALSNRGTVALHPGVLPASAQRRLRSGSLRQFSLDGGLQAVRRVPAPGGDRLRAEVSLVIVAEPQHAIVGMVTGAASLPAPMGDAQAQRRVEASLIASAVQAALRDVESYLAQTP